jgi:hypothetical protein
MTVQLIPNAATVQHVESILSATQNAELVVIPVRMMVTVVRAANALVA